MAGQFHVVGPQLRQIAVFLKRFSPTISERRIRVDHDSAGEVGAGVATRLVLSGILADYQAT
ncbi:MULTISPECIES: hypothetical protein [unclassified Mesorhizobium]|uniref:hypothetical protein n=1 Tax=unclassified Mesorhizobium TaxID=325217 RepID=UPI001597148E|nr:MULTISPECIES: hypothetical protein [unclassified Mesorhizobium]